MHAPSPAFAPPPPGPPPEDRPRRRFAVPLAVAGGVSLLVAVLWITGGLKEAPRQPVKAAGKPIDQGRFTVTVRDARMATVEAGLGTSRQRYIVVRMRVVNTGKDTASLGGGGLGGGIAARTKAGKWVKPDEVEGLVSGSKTTYVQPGLPVEASVMWKAGPADAPKQFTIGLRNWEYEPGFSDSTYQWRVQTERGEMAGRLTLPVAAG
ncbi:hypothetical protein [Spirillospora sp. NPDC029432]|uniref:hypothetical protein n=1 Tax=Spirillospora sp. NPDC029432 TaxID=3154599 RepID=UPI0034540A70